PLSNTFSYFCASVPLTEEDLSEYLQEPIAALPPAISSGLPKISIILVPYLEKANGKERETNAVADFVSIEKPPDNRLSWAAQLQSGNEEVLVFALKDQDVAEYHYRFYHLLASIVAGHRTLDTQDRYTRLLREELRARAHGEVDEEGWRLKQALLRRQADMRRETKLFREYAAQSFIDTLTLYLHGVCCDIDVETGPRQLQSRYLRQRLKLLRELYPPPEGYVVFPEEMKPR
ncbi:MAG: hypothetical protein ACRD9L_19285, partial [Bryobacteraceae bacterium]